MPHKILILAEDDSLREILAEELAAAPEFAVQAEKGNAAALSPAALANANLLLLAAGDEPAQTAAAIETLRGGGFRAPIILISGEAVSHGGFAGAHQSPAAPI